jgi:hypothetical protein
MQRGASESMVSSRGTSMAKDSLAAATTSIFKPGVASTGFRRLSPRVFARVTNDILQFMDFQLSAYGSRDFCVNYS